MVCAFSFGRELLGSIKICRDLLFLCQLLSIKYYFSILRKKKKSLKLFRNQGSEHKPVRTWQCGKMIGEGAEISSLAILSELAPLYSLFTLLPAGTPLFISYLEPKILCYSERNFPKELQRFLEMMDPSKKIPLLTWLCTKHHLFPPNRFFF